MRDVVGTAAVVRGAGRGVAVEGEFGVTTRELILRFLWRREHGRLQEGKRRRRGMRSDDRQIRRLALLGEWGMKLSFLWKEFLYCTKKRKRKLIIFLRSKYSTSFKCFLFSVRTVLYHFICSWVFSISAFSFLVLSFCAFRSSCYTCYSICS